MANSNIPNIEECLINMVEVNGFLVVLTQTEAKRVLRHWWVHEKANRFLSFEKNQEAWI